MSVVPDELIQRIDEQVRDSVRVLTDQVRAALNESGIRHARKLVEDSPDLLDNALGHLLAAKEKEEAAQDAYDKALLAAEWELDGRFDYAGNKTYLVTGDDRKAMTADERARWKAAEALKLPDVATARALLKAAQHDVAVAANDLKVAEKRVGAARTICEAAIAELNAFSHTLKDGR